MKQFSKSVVVVAGGVGSRMGKEVPKQFLLLKDKPILMHTLDRFYNYSKELEIILVLAAEEKENWVSLCNRYSFTVPHRVVSGGKTRFHSVQAGLAEVESELVAVHDGVRPFVSKSLLERCFQEAAIHQTVIPVVDVVDSIRKVSREALSETVDRKRYKLVQTPQVFRTSVLKRAYKQEFTSFFTDDASVVEAEGLSVHLVEGARENIKITTPFDLKIAEALLSC